MTTTQPSTPTSQHPPVRRPVGPLVCCTIATVVVTLLALFVNIGAMALLDGTAADRAMGTLLVVIGLVFLGTPAVLMWVALVRLFTEPPGGAKLMIACLRAVGGFFLAVALPTVSRSGSIAVMGAVIGIALAFVGTAQLLASATRTTTGSAA
jgi:membrane-associated HD superfamily phosphohydrolase